MFSFDDFKSFMKDFLKTRASVDIDNPETMDVLKKNTMKSSIMFLFILVSAVIAYNIATDRDAVENKLYYHLILILVPILVGIILVKDMFFLKDSTMTYEPVLKAGILLLVIFIVFQVGGSVASSSGGLAFMNFFINLVFILIIITGLAIAYFLFSNYIKQQTGAVGLFARILFYLPCLFADFVNYLKKELSITPSVVFILFFLELVFIILYAYLPMWVNKLSKINSHVLLKDPVDLNVETAVAGSKVFLAPPLEDVDASGKETSLAKFLRTLKRWTNQDQLTENELYKYEPRYRDNNYSISFWSYVNAGTMSDHAYVRESNILNYANGKPKISYVNDGTHKGHKYIIYLSNSPNAKPYEVVLPEGDQKWNYFAIIYHDHSADVFVNGKLVRTQEFNGNNVPLAGDEQDTIVVGSPQGLKGAICNISYYPYAISPREIAMTYNVLRFKNPPI